VEPILQQFAGRILPKLWVAVLFAGLLAFATTGTLEQALRYVAASCLLISFWLFGVALAKRRSFASLSEWDEGLVFSLIAACAHFLASLSG
jgi:hypothetical protein